MLAGRRFGTWICKRLCCRGLGSGRGCRVGGRSELSGLVEVGSGDNLEGEGGYLVGGAVAFDLKHFEGLVLLST